MFTQKEVCGNFWGDEMGEHNYGKEWIPTRLLGLKCGH